MIPSDRPERDRIHNALDQTLIVEAGAGTGKTEALTTRIENLLTKGKATADRIAAITFTRAAAAELRERIRSRLETAARRGNLAPEQSERVQAALEGLDRAAISTIHSFAESLVRERAVDIGLPLAIDPMDEVDSALEFEDRWSVWLDRALDDPEFAAHFARAARLGMDNPVQYLRNLALEFHNHYDRIRHATFSLETRQLRTAAQSLLVAAPALRDLTAYSHLGGDDPLYAHTQDLLLRLEGLSEVDPAADEALGILIRLLPIRQTRGAQRNWGSTPDGTNAATALKSLLADLDQAVSAELEQARRATLPPLLAAIQGFVLDYAAERRHTGRPEFHDLLVWARDLLAQSSEARAHFAGRYTHILIDEFQDTDPIQLEIALLLTKDKASRPGALFVVGDPKQSIYRFRGADPAAMIKLDDSAGEKVHITETFRTHTAIVDWVNDLFRDWMGREPLHEQIAYVDLQTSITPHHPSHGVHAIGGEIDTPKVRAVREAEAARIAEVAASVGAGQWSIPVKGDHGVLRPSRFDDLCIMFPTRTSLPLIEQALTDAEVPYTLEGQSLVFSTQEARDIISALTAIDDPSDEIAVVAALRSPHFACSDADLFSWHNAGGTFNYLESTFATKSPVANAFDRLRDLHESRIDTPTAALIERLVTDSRSRELAYGSRLTRERLRQIEVIIESARTLSDAGRPSLRAFVRWAEERARSGDRFPEGGIADIDHNAVRLMTIHHAKGLEFPIVLLAGLNADRQPPQRSSLLIRGGELAVRIGPERARFEYGQFDRLNESEKEADAREDIRKLYVATTRARNVLILSLHRKSGDTASLAAQIAARAPSTSPLLLPLPGREEAGSRQKLPLPVGEGRGEGPRPSLTDTPVAARDNPARYTAWKARRATLLTTASRPTGIAATALHARANTSGWTHTDTLTTADQPFGAGEDATALGRAVHAVLQEIDLATGANLQPLAAKHAALESIQHRADEIAQLVHDTLQTGLIKRAAESPAILREVYVAAPLPNTTATILEGYVDLLFEDPSGNLVIVDYKTDAITPNTPFKTAASPYTHQLAAYAHAVIATTGRPVAEAHLLFARAGASYQIQELRSAIESALRAAAQVTSTS